MSWWQWLVLNSSVGFLTAVLSVIFWKKTGGLRRIYEAKATDRFFAWLLFPLSISFREVFGKKRLRLVGSCRMHRETIFLSACYNRDCVGYYMVLMTIFGILPKLVWNLLAMAGFFDLVLWLMERGGKGRCNERY